MGRPSKYSQEIADKICERLIKPESLRSICEDDAMPSMATVCRWLADNSTFREQYARAREIQADVIADETQEIVDDGRNDWMQVQRGDETAEVINHEAIARSRLRFDQRRWYLSKLAPKKYGEKLDVEAKHDISDPLKALITAIRGRKDGRAE